ncbi:hypothetical protein [Agromyces soli]|uniref:Uncharacterized protein n=1 Tax=Agromyces soli TaxID=659012 RepID=A0ABY4AZT0_9MICO|nr:hypothetical protein [Agromyces soli]UOE27922.1 hypothetical protein MTP13_09150 [Agromyces soli]
MTEPGTVHRPPGVRGARRAAVVALVASISITAVVGIVVLLTGDFGEVQGRVLTTTLLVAGFSTVALCHLAVAGRPVRVVGFVGLAVSAIALVIGLVLIWTPWDAWNDGSGELWRWFGVTGVLALSLAHANLLLLLAGRRHPFVRAAMAVTLTAIALVALLVILPILSDGRIPGDGGWDAYWRWFGVIAIVDALGTIVLPVVGLLLRDRPAEASATGLPAATSAAPLAPDALDQRIAALAAERGLDREALLAAALDALEARPGRPEDVAEGR